MEELMSYVVNEALIVIPMLWVLGQLIKATPKIKDWQIPYILVIIGTTVTTLIMGFSVDSVVQGVLVSGAAVFGNELIKQAKRGTQEQE